MSNQLNGKRQCQTNFFAAKIGVSDFLVKTNTENSQLARLPPFNHFLQQNNWQKIGFGIF
jgi:hypothetical protein